MAKAHKDGTATFDELNYAEQEKSIIAQILNVEAAIKANIRRAISEGQENPKDMRINNIKGAITRLEAFEV
jgi:hypothetical protein